MTKRWFLALENAFAAEIENRLPFQSKAKVYKELEAGRCVVYRARILRFKDGFGPMRVEGWELTERGRLLYCSECKDVEG